MKDGKMDVTEAQKILQGPSTPIDKANEMLASFANLDHDRAKRTGFPEAVFGAGKTPSQVAAILDEMARNVNIRVSTHHGDTVANTSILATRYASRSSSMQQLF